jgi:hexosaminidase
MRGVLASLLLALAPLQDPPLPLVPWPMEVTPLSGERLVLDGGTAILVADKALLPLAGVLARELELVVGVRPPARVGAGEGGAIVLRVEALLAPGGYQLGVRDAAVITGADLAGVAAGTATLVQLARLDGGLAFVPGVLIDDQPAFAWRGVLIDCARHPQSIDTLEQVVELARFYKLRQVHLHLTDNEAFTFPSTKYPELATPGRGYTLAELRGLEAFAAARGVVLVPELDVPGHAAALVRARPDLFGLADPARNPGVVNIGRDATIAALGELIGELADVFRSSPYVHIGGDEAHLAGVDEDPDARATMARLGLADAHELQRHFLVRLDALVKEAGKQTLVWEGFRAGSEVEIPTDVVVMAWESAYQAPDVLARNGFTLINASWQPLYIVGGGKLPPHSAPRRWAPEHLFGWHARRFEHWDSRMPTFGGLELAADAPLLGAQLCVWEQLEHSVVPDLAPRAAAFSERLWNPDAGRAWPDFAARASAAAEQRDKLLRTVRALPDAADEAGRRCFDGEVTVRLEASRPGVVRYTLDGSLPGPDAPRYGAPLVLRADTTVRARLFDADGRPLGHGDHAVYTRRERQRVRYRHYAAPPGGWPAVPDFKGDVPLRRGTLARLRGGFEAGPLGVVLESTLTLPAAGEWEFDLRSFDGPSRLWIDGALVCDRARVEDWSGTLGRVQLDAGEHALEVHFAQGPLHTLCRVFVRGPGVAEAVLVDRFLSLPR